MLLDPVVLLRDIPEHGLTEGDVGAAVHAYPDRDAAEVEFVAGAGRTVAAETLRTTDVRALADQEILHVRTLAA